MKTLEALLKKYGFFNKKISRNSILFWLFKDIDKYTEFLDKAISSMPLNILRAKLLSSSKLTLLIFDSLRIKDDLKEEQKEKNNNQNGNENKSVPDKAEKVKLIINKIKLYRNKNMEKHGNCYLF